MLPETEDYAYRYARGTTPVSVNKTGLWRYTAPVKSVKLSPCRHDCLLDAEIPEWLEALGDGRWSDAWNIVSRFNPFPALTGYVCYNPCTENCNRGHLDQEIDIRDLEKEIGKWRHDHYVPPGGVKPTRAKVAVVGSGPAGLSCAYYLREAGYAVTVFEKVTAVGGMLALGIPEYRLPRRILDNELELLKEEGVSFVTGASLGENLYLEDLYTEFRQVFLATGAWLPRREELPGSGEVFTHQALDFLSMVNTGCQPEIKDPVVVVGGGNAAVDSARCALRLNGVNHVSLVYRRSRAEMPANPVEVEAAEREGVELIFNALPRKIDGTAGKTGSVLFDHCRTGREKLIVDRSKSFKKACGSLVMALGQVADFSVFGKVNRKVALYAGGDLVGGPASVAEAIRAGRLGALSIVAGLEGKPLPAAGLEGEKPLSFEELNLASKTGFELQNRLPRPDLEAKRCLGCGTCNSCGTCYLFCPDLAVERKGNSYEPNLDYCKGCGICARECPARALVMEGGL